MNIRRRNFIKQASLLAGGSIVKGSDKFNMGDSSGISNLIKIKEPFHGAILNYNLGELTDEGLRIEVKGEAPLLSTVTINGHLAYREGTTFRAEIVLKDLETEIKAIAKGWFGENSHTVRVVWDKNSIPRYRVVINNNIFFLRDIAWNNYNSLFDCFYLKKLRNINQKYGTKIVLNIYYTDGLEYSSVDAEEFDLSQFPDRYKKEWEENSSWLKLAFNGYSNKPDRPYQYSEPVKVFRDLEIVKKQIMRFAGPQSYTPPVAIHWTMVQQSVLPELAKQGVKNLSGGFKLINEKWDLNYNLDDVQSEYISQNDALMDFNNDIVFLKMDLTCNSTPTDQIEPILKKLAKDPRRTEIMNVFTHEQYFWPFYYNYLPDHFERLEMAVRWLTENNYKPVFFNEGFIGVSK